jgi:hypothetical protein
VPPDVVRAFLERLDAMRPAVAQAPASLPPYLLALVVASLAMVVIALCLAVGVLCLASARLQTARRG